MSASKFDYVKETLDRLEPIIQATHDQAIKTNGRVNKLEEWQTKIDTIVTNQVRIQNMLTGGLALWTFVSAGFITFALFSIDNYMENRDNKIKSELTEKFTAKLDELEVKEVIIK